jgi:acyl-CoA reductase-like NAD-dependent aldehyde dehydrogenase
MKVEDADHAVALANDSPYGLNSSVWTRDRARGNEVAGRLKAGTTCITMRSSAGSHSSSRSLESGDSGLGARHGAEGIRKYCVAQSLLETRIAAPREPHMFPYRARRSRLLERLIALAYGRTRRPRGNTHDC